MLESKAQHGATDTYTFPITWDYSHTNHRVCWSGRELPMGHDSYAMLRVPQRRTRFRRV